MSNKDNELQDFDSVGQDLNPGDLDFMDPASPAIETAQEIVRLCRKIWNPILTARGGRQNAGRRFVIISTLWI